MENDPASFLTLKEISQQRLLFNQYFMLRKSQLIAANNEDFETLQHLSQHEPLILSKLTFHNQRYIEFKKNLIHEPEIKKKIELFNQEIETKKNQLKEATLKIISILTPQRNLLEQMLLQGKPCIQSRKKEYSTQSPQFLDLNG